MCRFHNQSTSRKSESTVKFQVSLIECIKKAYIPEPIFIILEETFDMQRFIQGSDSEDKCIEQLSDISFQH
jgi:hypothetical protein